MTRLNHRLFQKYVYKVEQYQRPYNQYGTTVNSNNCINTKEDQRDSTAYKSEPQPPISSTMLIKYLSRNTYLSILFIILQFMIVNNQPQQPHQATPLKRSAEDWKNLRINLAKHGLQGIGESVSTLTEVQQLCTAIEMGVRDQKEVEQTLTQVLIPIAKILIALHVEDSTEQSLKTHVETTLQSLAKAGCYLFRHVGTPKAYDLLQTIMDFRKPVYKQAQSDNKQSANPEVITTNTKQEQKSAIPQEIPLPVIKEAAQSQDEICIEEDKKSRLRHPDQHFRAMKRHGYRQFVTDIADIFLEKMDKIEEDFPNRTPDFIEKYMAMLKLVGRFAETEYLKHLFYTVREPISKYFKQAEQSVIRHITKETLQQITGSCQSLFDRLLLDKEKLYWCEHFVVESTLPLVKCKLAVKKLFGVKLLSSLAADIQAGHSKSVTEKEFREWLVSNKVLEEIFNIENHQQVIQQGESIFEFLVKMGTLEIAQLDLVLSIAEKGNLSVRKSIINKIYSLTHRFGYLHYDMLMQRLAAMPHELFLEDMLDLIVSICRNSVNTHCIAGRQILWKLLAEGNVGLVDEKLAYKFIDMMKVTLQRGAASDMEVYITKAIQLLERKPQLSVLLLKRIVELYPQTEIDSPEKRLDTQLIHHIISTKQFHLSLLRKLQASDLNKEFRQNCLDLLSLLLTRYFKNFPDDSQMKTEMLLLLMRYPKLFSQVIQYFSNKSDELLSVAVSKSVNSLEDLHCIWELFINLNKEHLIINVTDKSIEVKCQPQNLRGYEKLIEIIKSTNNQQVRQETASYLAAIHHNIIDKEVSRNGLVAAEFVEDTLKGIQEAHQSGNQLKLLGYYSIIEEMMNETEKKGLGELLAHSSLVVTQYIRIKVVNEATHGYDVLSKVDATYPSSKSLYQMLGFLAIQFKCSANELVLYNQGELIRDTRNGLAVEDLNIDGIQLTAKKIQRQQIPHAKLLDESNNLTPLAKQVFTEVFGRFNTDGKMTKQHLVKFVESSTQDICSVSDSRITQTMDKYDDDKDGAMTLDNFLQFYEDASRGRESTVRRNLETLRYRPDLQSVEQVKETVDYHNMTRFRLYKCAFSYDILFELTQNKSLELRNKAIRLLKRLPTCQSVTKEILDEVSFQQKDEFNVWYRLTLIQYLLSKQQPSAPKTILDANIEKQPQPQLTTISLTSQIIDPWKKKFIDSQYYIKILQEAEHIAAAPLNLMTQMTRQSLSLCLKILRSLSNVPDLSKPLPDLLEVTFVVLPDNRLVEILLPQLFNHLIPDMLESLLCLAIASPNVDEQILKQGLFNSQEQVRLICSNFIYLHQKLHGFRLNLMDVKVSGPAKQFYELLAKVVRDSPNLDLDKIFSGMQREVETTSSLVSFDEQALAGRLAVMYAILQKQPTIQRPDSYQASLLRLLHGTVNHDLRKVLYSMLLQTESLGLVTYVRDLVKMINPKQSSSPKTTKYVGLYNLGCICYMNSMLQQFYMTDELRNAILSVQLPADLPLVEVKGKKHVENVLYQLQRMFSYLNLSDRSDYNIEGFCYSFKSNINVGIQQDSQEFLNSVVDKLQTVLKSTPYKNLLRDIFGGTTLSTLTCQSCSIPRYRVEQFRSILLEIKEKKNIGESLAKFIEKESISDFLCEGCQRRGEMIKQTHLHSLPNILIVNLQRIVFDLQTTERIKIHTKFEFPMQINLKDYVRRQPGEEPITEADCQYRLKGIVIHSGSPQSGHYYSLIRVGDQKWFKFNDSTVSEFNIRDLQEEAFGGREEYNEWASYDKNSRSKNAYILLYEKTNKQPIILRDIQQAELAHYQSIVSNPIIKRQTEDDLYTISTCSFNSQTSSQMLQQLEKDNRQYFHERQYHHENFRKFIIDLMTKISIPKPIQEEFQLQKLKAYYSGHKQIPQQQQNLFQATHEMLEALADSLSKLYNPDDNLIKEIGLYLYLLQFASPESAIKYFMSTDLHRIIEIMYSNNNNFVRELHRMIANKCINIIIHMHNVSLQSSESSIYQQKILDFLNEFLSLMYTEIPKNWIKSLQYFDFLRWFSCLNVTSAEFCFQRDLICMLVDLLLEKKSPVRTVDKKYELNIKYSVLSLGPILQTIVILVTCSQSSHSLIPAKKAQNGSSLHILTQNQLKCLQCIHFYKVILEHNKQDVANISFLINRFCLDNLIFSEEIAALLIYSINQSEGYESALVYMGLIHVFMLIKDGLTRRRLEWVFGVPQRLVSGNEFSIRNTLDSQVVTYISSLFFSHSNYKSILELMYSQRKSPDNFSIAGVTTLLTTLIANDQIITYVLQMPPPNYTLATYVDWIDKFIEEVRDQKYPTINGDRATIATQLNKAMLKVKEKLLQLRVSRGLQEVEIEQPPTEKSNKQTKQAEETMFETTNQTVELSESKTNVEEQSATIPQQIEPAKAHQPPETVLMATRPLSIIGRTHHIDTLPDITFFKEGEVRISPSMHYTYVTQSQPTGRDNRSLRKDLFEYQNNYDLPPLRYFTYKQTEIPEDERDGWVFIEPTVIVLKVCTKLPINLHIKHPELEAHIYMPEGTYLISTPGTFDPIESWLELHEEPKKEFGLSPPASSQQSTSNTSANFYSIPHSSDFIGPLPPDYYANQQTISMAQMKTIVCPLCTYENFGVMVCEVCYNPLPTT